MQAPSLSSPDRLLDPMWRDAQAHAARIATVVRERFELAPVLDREAHRRQTARRLAAAAGMLSGS